MTHLTSWGPQFVGTTSGHLPEVAVSGCGFGAAKVLVEVITDGEVGFRINGDEFSVLVSQNLERD